MPVYVALQSGNRPLTNNNQFAWQAVTAVNQLGDYGDMFLCFVRRNC